MASLWRETLQIINEAAPYLLAGFFLAGLLDALLRRYRRLTGVLTLPGRRPVFLAALLGAPLPLCSCSVLPAALTLRRQGASKGTTASFLISVPETDVTSIALTYALLGPFMAVARPVAALVTAITTGLVIDRLEPDQRGQSVGAEGAGLEPHASSPAARDADEPPDGDPGLRRSGLFGWLIRALRFGFVEMFDDIIVQLMIGIVIAGAIVAWFPGFGLETITGSAPAAYFVMLVMGIPLYVCATASTPLALGFIAGGVSPGAALVFLLVGPATNVASLVVLARQFGRRALALYITTLAAASIAAGLLVDLLLAEKVGAARKALEMIAENGLSHLPTIPAIVLLGLFAVSLWRTRRPWKWMAALCRKCAGAAD